MLNSMKTNFPRLLFSTLVWGCVAFFYYFCTTGFAQHVEVAEIQRMHDVAKNDTVFRQPEIKPIKFNGSDGPYIVNDTLYRVNSKNQLIKSGKFNSDSLVVRTDNEDGNEFYLALKSDYLIPESNYELPEKMVVISDIEGKYDAFASFLFSNKVIDENHNWIFEKGHLVLVGDFVDRGKNVTQVLWLIYKLEEQARIKGGQVHFILGNHEVLNFHGNHNYNRGKYIKVAQEISGEEDQEEAVKYLYSNRSEIGKWLATKNVIEKIGDYIFVHGGLSPDLLDHELTIADINDIVRSKFRGLTDDEDEIVKLLYGPKGPFWYRGLVMDRMDYAKLEASSLDSILSYYHSKKIVIGHTIVNNITTDYEGKVIRLDVSHGMKKFSGKTKGLMIENGKEFIIDDKGEKFTLSKAF